MAWLSEDLDTIGAAEELQITSTRDDGTPRRAVPIWVVRVGDDLYVRSYRGPDAAWYRHVLHQGAARIHVAGGDRDVAVERVADDAVNAAVDDAYRAKYSRYADSYVRQLIGPATRATTLRLLPR